MSAGARAAALLEWYGSQARDLPWRHTDDPWAILVSEVMLQQTPAGRVQGRYRAFLDRFPTPADLAGASLPEVLGMWDGLGYPRRAVRLREAAGEIERAGWPTTVDGLARLPGVGPYTAAAVACFAFGAAVPAIDVNLRRVLSRWAGTPLSGRGLAEAAEAALPPGDAATWNQAMMDLGATVCRPRPRCEACPVQAWCADPTVQIAGRAQAPYEGSLRQARGAVIRALVPGPMSTDELAAATGLDPSRLHEAVDGLREDGLVIVEAAAVTLS